jgi:hypothetical protein
MEAVLQPQARRANLLLHCGAHAVDREIIAATSTPEQTAPLNGTVASPGSANQCLQGKQLVGFIGA